MENVPSAPVLSKPKRPLSAFNLFYRFKRQKVLALITLGKADKHDICSLVQASPGLEDLPPNTTQHASPTALNHLRRENIRSNLEHNLLPRDTRSRSHRTNQGALNGAVSFLELGTIMSASWKDCDGFTRSVFNELAEEGRKYYRQRLKEYNVSGQEDVKALPTGEIESSRKKVVSTISAGIASKDDVSEDDSAENEMAEIIQNNKCAASPRLRLKGDASDCGNEINERNETNAKSNNLRELTEGHVSQGAQIHNSLSQPQHHQHHPNPNESEERLRLRVRELEGQLTEQRLRAHIRELQDELEKRKASEHQMRKALLANMISQSRAAVAAANHSSFSMPHALPGAHFMGGGMMHNNPSLQGGGRGANSMLPTVLHAARGQSQQQQSQQQHNIRSHDHRTSPECRRNSGETSEERSSNKKQRHG